MRRLLIALCVLSAGIAALAQAAQQPVFRGGVELVTLDVTVVDKAGKPIKGLKAEDFVVTLEGQTRPVRALDFLEFGVSAGSEATAADARQTTNQQAPGASVKRNGRVIVLLFDDLSFRPGIGKALTVAAQRMLPSFDADDLIGVATTSGLGPVVNPTRDRAALNAALQSKAMIGRFDSITAPFYIAVNEAIEIDRDIPKETLPRVAGRECSILGLPVDVCEPMIRRAAQTLLEESLHRVAMQITSYQHVIGALKAAQPPRVLIVLSSGVAMGVEQDQRIHLEPVARAAAEAGVQFYSLSDVPDEIDLSQAGEARSAAKREEGRFLNAGIQTVASAAGGEAFLVVGQADRFYKRIEAETSGFYRLGVEVPVSKDKRRFLKAKVSVRQSGATVRTNPQALAANVTAEVVPIDDRLRATLAQGGMSFGVPIAMATALRRDPETPDRLQLGVNIQVPSVVTAPLATMFSLLDEAGRVVQQGRKTVADSGQSTDFELALPIPLSAGRYRLRFAVADAAGNIGSLERDVHASLAHFGHTAVSELFTSWEGVDHTPRFLALEALPEAAETLHAALELYPDNPTAVPSLTVHLTLVPVGGGDPIDERELTPAGDGATRQVVASLPVADLKPGTYTLRARVSESGTVTGEVTTSIRKKAGGGGTR